RAGARGERAHAGRKPGDALQPRSFIHAGQPQAIPALPGSRRVPRRGARTQRCEHIHDGDCCMKNVFPLASMDSTPAARNQALRGRIRRLLEERQAVLVAHYYVDSDIQDLAEETGGCVADSLEMARFGREHPARTLVVAGVRFMGETAKILSPEKRVLVPRLDATCSLDEGCPPDAFAAFCDAHPDRTVIVYANTSAAVKARADWMVTSG